jgi:prepilin-type N-terminal cleavage/methylation domain-containing protein
MRVRTSGVTLIEMLIAVSLLSLLSVGMLMALRVGLNAMDKSNTKLMANRRSVSVQRILRSEIEGFMPVGADCMPGPDQPPVKIAFFDGRPESMRFVSSYSLQEAARGLPRIVELAVIPGEEGRGVRLIVNEYVYTGPAAAGAACMGMASDPETNQPVPQFAPVVPGPRSFVLADKLAYCRFGYRWQPPAPEPARWVAAWKRQEWPTAVRVDMAAIELDPSRVPLVGATIPIHVNRHASEQYTNY